MTDPQEHRHLDAETGPAEQSGDSGSLGVTAQVADGRDHGVSTELLDRIEQRARSYAEAIKLGDESPKALRSGLLYRIATRPDVVLGLVAEIRRLHALAEHYELCGRAYKRIRELNEICEAHPANADPAGNAAEVELMDLATKLQEYGRHIRVTTELRGARMTREDIGPIGKSLSAVDCRSKACVATEICAKCGLRKAPRGRSVPLAAAGSICDWECPGYSDPPTPGHLWPGEDIGP